MAASSPRIARFHRLGAQGPDVSAIGLGCMSLSGAYGESEDKNGIAVIHAALDAGVNFLDTADMYGWGHNESLVGAAIAGRRDEAFIATKFGHVEGNSGEVLINGRPDYVFKACDASLKRLKVDHIDLYYQHRVDPQVPIDETVDAMSQLVRKGKARFIGLSEAKPETIRRACRIHPIAAVQMEYSLLYRKEAEEVLAATHELGIGFVAYSPLGRGLLTPALRTAADVAGDRRATHPRFLAENFDHNRRLADQVAEMARAKRCTSAQLALAFLLADETVTPIPGTKKIERLWENMGALDVELSAEELAELREMIPSDAAAGERYPENLLKAAYL
ncbi:aldo/keto reductase [Methylocella silvestris BL2]|uniref:Aldo/keto reductase n=1 Tax=Methylocella silvestris (strain DSM 15510 / CIP 108128 / LMG 27833 / NCIMB 13906 / BL2) TaxID=395965 RepID=B8EP53_METSB|nr:aldo/keto reductase [Methylocella silvestris]ACK49641.1 aldo/keto reductase [Methylocella silvestris BL2]